MHYYIDGYNLLFRFLHAGDDLRTQREQIVQDLQVKVNLLQLQATVVFDSHFQPDEGSRSHLDHLEIIFTAQGETADEFILQELKEISSPAHHTVITSDKKLAWLCRRRLAQTESVEEFSAWLNKRYKNRLRQLKVQAKTPKPACLTTPQPAPAALPPAPAETRLPTKQATAEECFDYYLQSFEVELQASAPAPETKHPTNKHSPKAQKKPKTPPLSPEETHLSNMERWQRAFEKDKATDPWDDSP